MGIYHAPGGALNPLLQTSVDGIAPGGLHPSMTPYDANQYQELEIKMGLVTT